MKFKANVVQTAKDFLSMVVILSMFILLINGFLFGETLFTEDIIFILLFSTFFNIPYVKNKLGVWLLMVNKEIIEIFRKDLKEAELDYEQICDLDEPRRENYLNGKIDTLKKTISMLDKVGD